MSDPKGSEAGGSSAAGSESVSSRRPSTSSPKNGSTSASSGSAPAKAPKSRRKISMPWFRQSSFGMSLARLRLPKQHTIATSDEAGTGPPKKPQQKVEEELTSIISACDTTTWVIQDYAPPASGSSAGAGAGGPDLLSVLRGQQVELLQNPSAASPEMALVRLTAPASAVSATISETTPTPSPGKQGPEGLVPVVCLRFPPGGQHRSQGNRANLELDTDSSASAGASSDNHIGSGSGNGGGHGHSTGVTGSASPVGKKKGFSGKWLPNIRKLSQGKLEKTSSAGQDARSSVEAAIASSTATAEASASTASAGQLHKQVSKNKFKLSSSTSPAAPSSSSSSSQAASSHLPEGMGNRQSHSESEDQAGGSKSTSAGNRRTAASAAASAAGNNAEDGEDPLVEVPPPMQPIASVPLSSSASANAANAAGSSDEKDPSSDAWMASSVGDGPPSSSSSLPPGSSSSDMPSASGAKRLSCDPEAPAKAEPAETDPEAVDKAIQQRYFRLQELHESEQTYVQDLSQCVDYIKFMKESKESKEPEIPMPEDLREGKDRMIFGNIEAIYEWHRDFFLKNLGKTIDNPVELGNLFKKYDRKFQMYVVYCQNKPKSEYIVSEHIDTYFEDIRNKLGYKLRLTDLLIKPIQRLTKYHMLLEAILKYSQRAGLAEEAAAMAKAFFVMTVVPNQANDMMDIGRLQGFEGKITAQGKLLNRGPLLCLDTFSSSAQNGPPKMKPFTVFLFEQIMIFSETVGKKTQFTSPVYVYKNHFLVNKMSLHEQAEELSNDLQFVIRSNDPAREELSIVCQAEDQECWQQWVGIMRKQLQTQMDFLKALQAPIAYHSQLAKD